jgi:hypothetical protein
MLLGCLDVDEEQGHKSNLAANHKFAAEKCGWATIVVSSQVPHLGSRNRQMVTGTWRSRCHFAVARLVHDGGPSQRSCYVVAGGGAGVAASITCPAIEVSQQS